MSKQNIALITGITGQDGSYITATSMLVRARTTRCQLSQLVAKAVGFEGTIEFDTSKPDGTMRKLIDVSKLHSLGWTHKVEIEEGVQKLFEWYKE